MTMAGRSHASAIRHAHVHHYEEQDPVNVTQTRDSRQGLAQRATDNATTKAVADALHHQETFTREQLAWLMSQAMRWGYELRDAEDRGFWAGYNHRVAEENADWPDTATVIVAGEVIEAGKRKAARETADATAGLPRPGDHRGGPVSWDATDHMRVAA